MRNSKKIIIPIIIILILLLIAGGAFAYVYMETDILKTDKELFFKYFAQITSEDGFVDKGIKDFNEKKKQTPYENSGEITVEVEYPEDEIDAKIIEKVNDLAITFSGKVDSINQKVEKNIEVDYGNDVIFPINYRQDGNNFGIQIDNLSKKFIAIRNENLDKLAENLGGESIASIPDKITTIITELNQPIEFSETEKEQLKQIYGTILEGQLLDENFSSIKMEQSESYTLELSNEQVKNIIIKMLEATKQNTLIIDKVNELILAQDSESETIDTTSIDEIIESINEEDTSNIPDLKITLVQSNKQLKQIIIEYGESKISIEKNVEEDSLSYSINCDIIETIAESNSILEPTSSSEQYNVYFNVQYSGLDSLSNIQEIYEFGYEVNSEYETMKYDYNVDINTQFAESVSIEKLNEDVAIFLNDYSEEQVTTFLGQVGTKLLEINKTQMEILGLKEHENPLLYSNPITMIVVSFYNMASETSDNIEISDYQIQQFNSKFEAYIGDDKTGTDIKMLISTVQGDESEIVKVILDGNEISDTENVNSTSVYMVEAIYNEDGLITEIKVTTKE